MIVFSDGLLVAGMIIGSVILVTAWLVGYYSGWQRCWEDTYGKDQIKAQQRMKEQREAAQDRRNAWIDAQMNKGVK